MNTPFVEENCTIEHEGKTFEAGGSYLCNCSDGYVRGTVYAKKGDTMSDHSRAYGWGKVTTWHGEEIAKCYFYPAYRNNMGAWIRPISFTVNGIAFKGRYGEDWKDCVNVKSTKKATL